MIPAFSSPAPTRIFGDLVGNVFSSGRLFLYEQCSLHMTEKIPSSVYVGSRPRIPFTFSYSSGVRLCFRTNSVVIAGSVVDIGLEFYTGNRGLKKTDVQQHGGSSDGKQEKLVGLSAVSSQ